MLTEIEEIQILILDDGQLEVRKQTVILQDGNEVARSSFHRHVVAPGDDLDVEEERVKAIGLADHTPERIAAYREKMRGQ